MLEYTLVNENSRLFEIHTFDGIGFNRDFYRIFSISY